ncbi:hypothetical protein D3C74_462530 [compost metagenome]
MYNNACKLRLRFTDDHQMNGGSPALGCEQRFLHPVQVLCPKIDQNLLPGIGSEAAERQIHLLISLPVTEEGRRIRQGGQLTLQ